MQQDSDTRNTMSGKESQKPGTALKKSNSGNKRKILWVALTLLVAGSAAATYFYMESNKQEPSPVTKRIRQVKRGPIDLRVTATGTIRPINQVKISPKFTGLLKKLYVQQGEYVKQGQLLAVMDDSNLQGQWQSARAAYQAALANYEKTQHGNRPQEVADAEAQYQKTQSSVRYSLGAVSRAQMELRAAEASLLRDDTNARRLTELAKQGAVSDQEKLNAVTQAEVSRARLDQAKQDLKQSESSLSQTKSEQESVRNKLSMSKEGYRAEDVKAAYQSMIQAEGNFKYLQSQLNDTQIKAPFSGVVTQKYTDQGAIVTPTTSAATTSATSSSIVSLAGRLELVAAVSETDMEHISKGQEVTIIANSYPSKRFHGQVNLIAPEAIVTQNVTSFEIHATIDDDKEHLLMSGMNVNAEFAVGKKDDALLIPTSCIVTKKGKTGVYIPDKNNQPKFVAIIVGETSGLYTVVNEGLKEGSKVFVALTKEQLTEEGYGDNNKGNKGGKGMGGSSGPVPRGFGKM